jgi:hypothetical protein
VAAYVKEGGDLIVIGNDLVEFGFDRGALVSLIDKATDYQFVRDRSAASPFSLTLRRADGSLEEIDGRAFETYKWTPGDGLTLTFSGLPDLELSVTVRIDLDDSALSRWRVEVSGLGDGALHQVTCPIIPGLFTPGDPAPGETVAAPRQSEGYLFRDPYPVVDRLPLRAGIGPESPDVGLGVYSGLYPGGIGVQFMLYYNDLAGLYLATHDAGQNVKRFDLAPREDAPDSPVLSVSHFQPEEIGADVAVPYETILGVFHGDWYDGVDIYKAWATGQWWCREKLWDRDIPSWMRTGFAVFEMSNYHMPILRMNHPMAQVADVVNDLSVRSEAPLLALIFNWERGGAWTGPLGFFPPREGAVAFREAMTRLREAGNHGFVYITGGCWYLKAPLYSEPYDSEAEFDAQAVPYAITNPDGSPNRGGIGGLLQAGRLCPHTDFTRDLTADIFVQCLELGCSVVQIDNFPCVGSEACFNSAHGHPLGHGPWWSEAWGRILAETRRRAKAVDPDCAITVEGVSEGFIPWLDMFDQRAANMEYFGHRFRGDLMNGETIPIFSYVYNEYIGAYTAAYPECNRPEVLYWTRAIGKAVAEGVVPTGGWYLPEPDALNPVTTGFFCKVARAVAHELWPYLMFGEMLRPPAIDVPEIVASYLNFADDYDRMDPAKRHEVRDRAVQHASFRARDGSVGLVFLNISEEPVGFDVELPDYGSGAAYDVDAYVDGVHEDLHSGAALPITECLNMAPLSVTLVVLRLV